MAQHARDYEDLQTVQRLKMWLKGSLIKDSDGWFPNEIQDAAKNAYGAAYDELTVEKTDRLWPFNSR